ncbi:S1 family peptidase [Umezawaea beigongshangensis]|uniref:S1 family peptidase n=1 Tax=Umezawaea beigongshangensis TaxID=2780383 RepID=UPI001E5FE94B|nr:trypsin-like serine protease [Umezawaea beigongshangensis]
MSAALVTTATTLGAGTAEAVAHGVPAAAGQFPYAVQLTAPAVPNPDGTTRGSACSASLIAPRWVVTAGHCFRDVDGVPVSGPVPYPVTATIGTVDLDDGRGTRVEVVEVRQSPVNDVSIAKLATPVTGVRPVALPSRPPVAGEELTLAGWGATETTTGPSKILHFGEVEVSSVDDTTAGVHGVWPRPDTSACPYDSGAPYVRPGAHGRATIVSVESDGPACPHAEEETTARVDVIADWIRREIRG